MRLFKEMTVKTSSRNQFIDISRDVISGLDISKVEHGILLVFIPHTTAAVTINENADSTVKTDMLRRFAILSPDDPKYQHMEGNSDAHVKTSLTGSQVVIPIENGQLILGTWQGIYFCEYDGPRTRKAIISIIVSSPNA